MVLTVWLVRWQRPAIAHRLSLLFAAAVLLAFPSCSRNSTADVAAENLHLDLKTPFRFVAYGDARFHDPRDTGAANPEVRVALVKAIAEADPAFICFPGDLVYNGDDANDWKVWDSETAPWREKKIPVYPTLGNHELHGSEKVALQNYFQRFPDLHERRHYSVHAANVLVLVLDSALAEVAGEQGQWLMDQLDHVDAEVDFVFVVLHHPPYTSSSDDMLGNGHSARSPERALGKFLEERQVHAPFRIVVFSGHVHNYERHEHGGVTYFVTGGAGAHAYPIRRLAGDAFQSKEINYHYLMVEVDHRQLKVTMNRLDVSSGKQVWSQPDMVRISVPDAGSTGAAASN